MEVVTRDDTLVFLGGREFFSCITAISVCETPVAACSGWADPVAAFTLNTILDKIIEFAKISAGLNFYVRATLRLWHSECPSDTDVLKISSLPKRGAL